MSHMPKGNERGSKEMVLKYSNKIATLGKATRPLDCVRRVKTKREQSNDDVSEYANKGERVNSE